MRAAGLTILTAAALGACSAPPAATDVDAQTLRAVGDRFDAAQIGQDGATLARMVDDGLVFVGSNGRRETKAQFIADWVDPTMHFEPITIQDRVILPLGPDAGVVGGDVVLRGTAGGQPFASRIRYADTFRRIDGEWRAVHIQATKVVEAG